jgi:hypothetical protein
LLLGLAVVLLTLVLASDPVQAQGLPGPPLPGKGLTDLLANPGKWMTDMFNAALVSLGEKTTSDIVGFMSWLLGGGNVISQTPPGLSYDSEAVRRLWNTMRLVGDAGLAVVAVWGGINLIVHPQIRAPYHGALELVPRLLLSGVLVNTSLDWGHLVIDLNNALCQALGSTSIPAWSMLLQPHGGPALVNLIAMAIYLVMGLLLLGQMLMRLALLDALLVIGPLALLCWVLPQTYSWARLWFSTFFGTVFVQSIQVLVLQLGAELIQSLPKLLPSGGPDAVENGRVWLMTLLLGIAILQLTRKIPRLVPGYAGLGGGGGLNAGTGMAVVRFISSFVRPGSGGAPKGGK